SYERLRSLEQLRDDLVKMIVHDMRSPLSALLINLHLLRSVEMKEENREELEAAVESARRLTQMATELLDVSRLEQGQMPIERGEWDLTKIAHDVRSELQALDHERLIEIESAGQVHATCDGTLVRRVLENLVSNGIKHTPAGTRIRICVAKDDGRVRVAV